MRSGAAIVFPTLARGATAASPRLGAAIRRQLFRVCSAQELHRKRDDFAIFAVGRVPNEAVERERAKSRVDRRDRLER